MQRVDHGDDVIRVGNRRREAGRVEGSKGRKEVRKREGKYRMEPPLCVFVFVETTLAYLWCM